MTTTAFHPDHLTVSWLSSVIDADDEVVAFELEPIGTGQVGANYRIALTWAAGGGPDTVVAKFASLDEQSRATGVQTLTYEREVAFYREVRNTVDVAAPHVHFVDIRPGTADVIVLMEDLAPREQGDQLAGCTVDEAALAMTEAARLHGPRWGDPTLEQLEWLSRRAADDIDESVEFMRLLYAGFVDRYGERLSESARELGDRLMPSLGDWYRSLPDPVTVTHGDFRLDNMLFGSGLDRPLVVVDWQTPGHGHGATDVAYFLGAGLLPEDRRAAEQSLVEGYHRELVSYPGAGEVSFDEIWTGYRSYTFSGFLMAVAASMIVGRTERGDDMFMAMANRHADQAWDLDSMDLVG